MTHGYPVRLISSFHLLDTVAIESCMIDSTALDGIGWLIPGEFIPPESHERQSFFPRLRVILDMFPAFVRLMMLSVKQWLAGKAAFINVFSQMKHDHFTGVPIGGIGCGSIGTDFRGGFNKFALIPGIKEQRQGNVKGDQFILTVHMASNSKLVYQTLLSAADFTETTLSSWKSKIRRGEVRYRGLFPRAWREVLVADIGLKLICEQVSPVLPNNYEVSSFPLCNFYWTVINNSKVDFKVTLTFTFRNGTGNPKWEREGECSAEALQTSSSKGLKLKHTINSMPTIFAIAAEQIDGAEISYSTFNPASTGEDIWRSLQNSGLLSGEIGKGVQLGVAVSSRFDVPAVTSKTCAFTLAWLMPVVHFGKEQRRFYTRYVGDGDAAADRIIDRAMKEGKKWRAEIENWQKPIIENESLPDWYRAALFNELYYIVDGASMWFEYDPSWKNQEQISPVTEKQLRNYGRFGYMESWEYLMVNTYDVHFYASWALVKNWPQLQLSLQLDFCDQLTRTDMRMVTNLTDGSSIKAKTSGRIPHDLGIPLEEPWVEINGYTFHDSANWRDLNLKFVLSCWRDYKLIVEKNADRKSAIEILSYFHKQSEEVIRNALEEWDPDGDGMIENSGTADQTYDAWTMTGTSAYCGSLWLAALSCVRQMATELKNNDSIRFNEDALKKARGVFVTKLWNGRYFNFDETSARQRLIMADQLCGIWFLTLLQQDEIISEEQVTTVLQTIYDYNVKKFANGNMGPVNGILENGTVDYSSMQSEEVWTGTAYGLASFMIAKGKWQQGFDTARGIVESCWQRMGFQYQTPEAIYEQKYYRAIGYMRPLAIWAIQHALQIQADKKH